MKNNELISNREGLGKTQVQMASLLGCSLVGYKRFESGSRPLPEYIAREMEIFLFCQTMGEWEDLQFALTQLKKKTRKKR